MKKKFNAIGLMSGTSADGIDLALVSSDGRFLIDRKNFLYFPYSSEFRSKLKEISNKKSDLLEIKLLEKELTILHANLVNFFLKENKINREEIDLISFHGHTIIHSPSDNITWQIGNENLLCAKTGIATVKDFREFDVAFGGQGAPLVPIYHFHLFPRNNLPTLVLNIGGISNITYFNEDESSLEAFDVCFGNAPFDDLIKVRNGVDFDKDGLIGMSGTVDYEVSNRILENKIFTQKPPKSFDRNSFIEILKPIESLETKDALASLSYIHAMAILKNIQYFDVAPKSIFVCGGGRKNKLIMSDLKKYLTMIDIKSSDEIGLNGDSIEAEAFAFLGIRRFLNLPISFPKTTGFSLNVKY